MSEGEPITFYTTPSDDDPEGKAVTIIKPGKSDIQVAVSPKRVRMFDNKEEAAEGSLADEHLLSEKSPLVSSHSTRERLARSWQRSRARSMLASVSTMFSQSVRRLKKSVGFGHGFALIVGILIGSGIFISPSLVAKSSESMGMALLIWTASGFIALFGSLCYCELGCAVKKAGGNYAYIYEAYGPIPAFLAAWTTAFIIDPAGVAAMTLTFGTYIVKPIYDDASGVWLAKLLAAVCIVIIGFVNCWSVTLATRAQVVFTVAQVLAVVFVVVLGLWQIGEGHTENFENIFVFPKSFGIFQLGQLGIALYNGLWSYDGWSLVSNITEEIENLERNLFLSIVTGIPFVMICYTAVNLSLMSALTKAEIGSSTAVAITFVDKIIGRKASYVMPVFVALSCYGAANGTVFACGRLTLAAGREGHMPELLSMIHRDRLTPIPAVVLTSIISLLMLIPDASNLENLISYFNFSCWIIYGLSIFAVIVLRIRKPELPRPYKVFITTPIIMTMISLFLVMLPFFNKPVDSAIALVTVLSGLPAYFVFIFLGEKHPQWLKRCMKASTRKVQKGLNLVPCRF